MELSSYIACQHCDVVHELKNINFNEEARCVRCGSVLYTSKEHFADKSLAFSIAALLFYIPANFYPLLTMSVIGNVKANSLLTGVIQLFNKGYYFVSVLVLLTSIVFPFLSISTLLYTMLAIKLDKKLPYVNRVFRIHEQINNWVMLEVYMLGILVALTKLGSIAKVSFGIGLYCYIALLLATIFSNVSFDSLVVWERVKKWTE